MSSLDKAQKYYSQYIDILSEAGAAGKKAQLAASLLGPQLNETRKEGLLERFKAWNQFTKLQQQGKESPANPQAEATFSMAPPEVQPTGTKGLTTGKSGFDMFDELEGGRGVQKGQAGAGLAETPPGYRASATTQTVPGTTGYPLIDMALRRRKPEALGTITRTSRTVERDPELFQTNVTSLASTLEMPGGQDEFYKAVQEMGSVYGPQYTLQAAQAARATQRTNLALRLQQLPTLMREYSGEYNLDPAQAQTAARLELEGKYDELQKFLGGERSATAKIKQIQLKAAEQSLESQRAQTAYTWQLARASRISNDQAEMQLNSVPLSTKVLGYSMTSAFTNKFGQTGGIGGKEVWNALNEIADEDGNVKPGQQFLAQGFTHYMIDQGGLPLFGVESTAGGIKSFFSSKTGTLVIGLEQARQYVMDANQRENPQLRAQAVKTLEDLKLGKRIGNNFYFAHEMDIMDDNAESSRALAGYINVVSNLPPEARLETRRGYKRLMTDAQAASGGQAPRELGPGAPTENLGATVRAESVRSKEQLRQDIKKLAEPIQELGKREARTQQSLARVGQPQPTAPEVEPRRLQGLTPSDIRSLILQETMRRREQREKLKRQLGL